MRKSTITEKEAREHLEYYFKNIEKIRGQYSYNHKRKIKEFRLIEKPLSDAQILGIENLIEQLESQITPHK